MSLQGTKQPKPTLVEQMQACTDVNDLGILYTEIQFLAPELQVQARDVYESRINALNA